MQYEVPHWLYIEIYTVSRGFLATSQLLQSCFVLVMVLQTDLAYVTTKFL